MITITGTAKRVDGDGWANARVEISLEEQPEQKVTAVCDADGAFSIGVETTAPEAVPALAKLPDGSEFQFSLDPEEETIALGNLLSNGGDPAIELTAAGVDARISDVGGALNIGAPGSGAGIIIDTNANALNIESQGLTQIGGALTGSGTRLDIDDTAQTIDLNAANGVTVNGGPIIQIVTTTVQTNVGTKQALLAAVPTGKVRIPVRIVARNASTSLAAYAEDVAFGFDGGALDVGGLGWSGGGPLTDSVKFAIAMINGAFAGGASATGVAGDVLGVIFFRTIVSPQPST